MARRHSKKHTQKVEVERILVKPAVVTRSRIVTEVADGTDGAIPIVQEDGSTKFFVVRFKEVSPAVYKIRALGPTTLRGLPNDTKNMAPRGSKGAAPLMRKKGQ